VNKKIVKNKHSLRILKTDIIVADVKPTKAVIINAFFLFRNSLDIRNVGKIIKDDRKALKILMLLKINIVSLKIYAGEIDIGYNGGYL
jgi:hypothetical protein